jgi:phage repressor protein C with HTH and peptisase S24 domain
VYYITITLDLAGAVVSHLESQTLDTIQQRLLWLIGEESIYHFANRCGLPDSTLRKYLKGSQPTADRLALISDCTGVSVAWLVTGAGEPYPSRSQTLAPDDDLVRLPLYEITAGAGNGLCVDESDGLEMIAFRESWLRQKFRTSAQGLHLIYVRGESMEPTLRSGDIILLDTKATEVSEGIYVLRIDTALFVKRLHLLPGGQLQVSSDNPAYESFVIDLRDPPDDFAVIGRTLWSLRSHD